MSLQTIQSKFESVFDLVSIIPTKTYVDAAKSLNKGLPDLDYETLVVLAYAYPKRTIASSKTHLVPSFYTFGEDYHRAMKKRIKAICDDLGYKTSYGVDNHPLDERLMASLSGIGFLGKNQLIISQTYGSYIFLAYVLIDHPYEDLHQVTIDNHCGTCRQCIDACPTNALSELGYDMEKCMSFYNQEKIPLSTKQMKDNYALFGCDICQLVCPKNLGKGKIVHQAFELNGNEKVAIEDIFNLTKKAFNQKYHYPAYMWKGKTLLMRNAAMMMYQQKNADYLDLLEASLEQFDMPWYQKTLNTVINALKK